MSTIYKYDDEVRQFIFDNVEGTTTRDLVELVNSKFNLSFTVNKMRSFKKNHNLRSNTRVGVEPGQPTKLFPAEIFYYILENYRGVGPKEMMERLNSKFGTEYSHQQLKSFYNNRKLNSGLDGRFKPGRVPHNKGTRGLHKGGEATQFKKGNLPHNYQPVGTVRVNSEGYIDIKIADPNVWKGKHILVWEQHNGPVPEGHCVIFGDRNRRNFDPENLILVSRAQLARLNQNGLIKDDADLTKAGLNIVNLQQLIADHKKG
ncbi:MAG: HNH endonuclease signature motif containing protein [Bacillota bacterium]|nr:HNH endonuclease signature motif containing protein [Bacillota bacterium]